ncbi:MAG TPA: NfeD family protein [Roseiflexaceae bacterium]|nr:NfeD family protein [Roseiflexaceae bacterium]
MQRNSLRRTPPVAHMLGIWLVLLGLFVSLRAPAHAQDTSGPIYTVDVGGTITAVTVGYLEHALRVAESSNATALIITLHSGGGVLRDIRPFAARVAGASVPVVVYVSPEGVQAGAPGTLLLSAAHIAAMAPGTSFGSPYPLTRVDSALSDQTRRLVFDSVVDQLRSWNSARGRNTAWIDRAVGEGAVLSNEQAIALQPPAVDIVAASREQLLTTLEGRNVTFADGRTVVLSTLGRTPQPVEPSLWESLRLALSEPTVAFALLVLGALAIYLEFAAPGTTVFAGLGLLMIAAAALGLVVLPIQPLGLLLVVGGLLLVGVEFFVTAHGGFALAGLIVLVIGAINLIDPLQAPGASVSGWAIGMVAAGLAGGAALITVLVMRTRRLPPAIGSESLVGRLAEVRQRLDPEGMVFVEGALWRAVSEGAPAEVGDVVRVSAMHNLRLVVRPVEIEEQPASQ